MRRQLKHILLSAVTLASLMVSCVEPLEPLQKGPNGLPVNALIFSPSVLDNTLATKTDIDELGENTLATLDVYVYKISGSDTSFFKRYHFPNESVTTMSSGDAILLESDWRNAGYDENTYYRIYAVANSQVAESVRKKDYTTEANLKEALLSTSPETHSASYDLVRLMDGVGPTVTDNYYDKSYYNIHIANKTFVMDGFVNNWRINQAETQQYFTDGQTENQYFLKRAAAKFELNFTFGSDFVNSLTEETWYDEAHTKIKTRKVTAIGKPQFKFTNFLPVTHELTPASPEAHERLWTSEYAYYFPVKTTVPNSNPEEYTYPYSLTTYSYAFSWDASEAAEVAPSILVSVPYTGTTYNYNEDGSVASSTTGPQDVNYYRVPLVDLTSTKEIKRNYFYKVTATINTLGSTTVDIEPTKVNLKYKVIPWPASYNDETDVEAVKLEYFVAEKEYRLRGDGRQWVRLPYFTPVSDDLSDLDKFKPVISNVRVYYKKDANDAGTNIAGQYSGGNNDPVTIAVEHNEADGGGQFYITSVALDSRAVKYIEFDATVTFENSTITQHFIITHFPLDNIQSINGAWSSYVGTGTTTQAKEYTYDPAIAQKWGVYNNQHRESSNDVPASFSSAANRRTETGSPLNYDERVNLSSLTQYQFQNALTRTQRAAANGEANAIQNNYDYYDYYYYWGEDPVRVNDNSYDYYVQEGNRYYYYKYSRYYRSQYVKYYYTGYRWWRYITAVNTSGNWIDWDRHTGNKYSSDDGHFTAKFWGPYYGKSGYYTYSITSATNGQGTNSENSRLTNNHMYVIQISKSEEGIVLGRPLLNGNKQSQDNVVSPAFMIASQLGAVQNYGVPTGNNGKNGRDAAAHCANYMEVSDSGKRFTEWRLPTAAEVAYIIRYQTNSDVVRSGIFSAVLTGQYYHTLDGSYAETGVSTDGYYAVRCVRDLTPEEIIILNETGKIPASNP